MNIIIGFLSILTIGSVAWTIIQIVKPEAFFNAEEEANIKRVRPKWYLIAGIFGIIAIGLIWYQAFKLKLFSVWVLTAVLTIGSAKPLGIVFFYDKFSKGASDLVNKMKESKKLYWTIVASRGILSVVLMLSTLYFLGYFGAVR